MKIKYSEVFTSFQGEAGFAGMPTIWVRFFGCTLKCMGFGQKDPTNPSTYQNPYKTINIADYKKLEDLPVFEVGCDSAYSWDPLFKNLVHTEEVKDLVDRLIQMGMIDFGLDRFHDVSGTHIPQDMAFWHHPKTKQPVQLCFTGGEPMLWQKQMIAIVEEFHKRGMTPPQITIETNATKPLQEGFLNDLISKGIALNFSVSPKLFSVSGEQDAVKPEIIREYLANPGWLKFVVDGSEKCWKELDEAMEKIGELPFRSVWLMPVGATKEQQEHPDIARIALECMRRGYLVATRNHAYVFANLIGK